MARTFDELSASLTDEFKDVIRRLHDRFVGGAKLIHGRATHSTGLAARGEARVIVGPEFPRSDFLAFGKRYPVIVRHATTRPAIKEIVADAPVFDTDDRMLDGAAMSVKFLAADAGSDGFHDLLMNAGRVLFVPSARAFLRLISTPNDQREQLVKDGDLDDDLLTEGYRSGSFTEFYYHSQIAFEFTDLTGTTRYLKFRAIPADRGPERGLMAPSFRANRFTFQDPWPDDRRAEDYRRRDLETRVRHQTVEYLLQAQVRPTGPRSLLNPMLYWEERAFPWLDVAYIRLTEILTPEEMHLLNFHVNRTHASINLALATSADGPESIGHARALVYTDAWLARKDSPEPHRV